MRAVPQHEVSDLVGQRPAHRRRQLALDHRGGQRPPGIGRRASRATRGRARRSPTARCLRPGPTHGTRSIRAAHPAPRAAEAAGLRRAAPAASPRGRGMHPPHHPSTRSRRMAPRCARPRPSPGATRTHPTAGARAPGARWQSRTGPAAAGGRSPGEHQRNDGEQRQRPGSHGVLHAGVAAVLARDVDHSRRGCP